MKMGSDDQLIIVDLIYVLIHVDLSLDVPSEQHKYWKILVELVFAAGINEMYHLLEITHTASATNDDQIFIDERWLCVRHFPPINV